MEMKMWIIFQYSINTGIMATKIGFQKKIMQ